jgi:predicted ATPase
MSQLRDGIAAYRATGAEVERSHWLGLLAEACGDAGQPEEGLQSLAGALEEIKRNGINYYEAELHRLRGELLVARSDANGREAEASFREAIEIASRQQAKLVELRATTSLSRLLQRQGKREDAARMLANVYDWFREGFATEDFRAAKLLLEELSMA